MLSRGVENSQCLIPVSSAVPAVLVLVVVGIVMGGVTGLPDAPLGEVVVLGIVGVLSILTPLSFMVMMGKYINRKNREEQEFVEALSASAGGCDVGGGRRGEATKELWCWVFVGGCRWSFKAVTPGKCGRRGVERARNS